MRAAVIFNPIAGGHRAGQIREALQRLAEESELLPTDGPGSARNLAADACRRGWDTVIAAGGDGTVSEVADGLAQVRGGLESVRVGVVPLGTINVFARELRIPRRLRAAWRTIKVGRERRVDLPLVEVHDGGQRVRRHFVQLAGCGLDSRSIAGVDREWKRRVGPLAYVAAVWQAMGGPQPRVRVAAGQTVREGELVLVGNGRLYGGDVTTFPGANPDDGLLDARVFSRVTLLTLARFCLAWLLSRPLSTSVAAALRAKRFEIGCATPMPVEVDGDNVGHLPATFAMCDHALRVIVP